MAQCYTCTSKIKKSYFFFILLKINKPEDHWSCIAHLSAEDMLNLNKLGNARALNAL